jgi:predicted RNase H-like HicB family nuclease
MFQIETEQETDGRWIAEIEELSGAMVYELSKQEAIRKVKALTLRILEDQLEHGEIPEDEVVRQRTVLLGNVSQ